MASLTVRKLDEKTKELLRRKAQRNGRSMEDEVRSILTNAVTPDEKQKGLGSAIHELFRDIGGADDLPLMPRDVNRPPPDFGSW
jgi:antitoxin FitA